MASSLERLFMIITAIILAIIAYSTYTYIVQHYGEQAIERSTNIEQASYRVISPLDGSKVPVYYVKSSNGTITDAWFYITVASTLDNLDTLDAMPISITNGYVKDIEVFKEGDTIIEGTRYTVYRVKVHIDPSYKGGILNVLVKNSGVTLVGYMTEVNIIVVFPINNSEIYIGQLPIKIKNTGEEASITDLKVYIDGSLIYQKSGLNVTLKTDDVYTFYITTSTVRPGLHKLKVIINNGAYAYTLYLNFKRRPTIVLQDVDITYKNDINGTIFEFTAKLVNNDNTIHIIKKNTISLYLGEMPLEVTELRKVNGQDSDVITIGQNETFIVKGIKRLIAPGDSVVKVIISNYETNSLPISIPLVKNIYMIDNAVKINLMNITIRNTGNRYFIFNSIAINIGGKNVRIVQTPPLGKYINVLDNFIVTVDTTGLTPGRMYPINIIINNDIKWSGKIYIPYDRELQIMNVTATENELNLGVKYLGNIYLYYRKGTLIFKLTNSTTPTIYLLTDDYSQSYTNFKPKTSFELEILEEPIAHRFENGDLFQITSKIPFPLAGSYLVNFTVNKGYNDEANGYGVFVIFSMMKGITINNISYSTEHINTIILQPQYVVNSEDDIRQDIKKKLMKINTQIRIYTYNMIKKVVVSGYSSYTPLYVNIVNITEPRVQNLDIPVDKNIPYILTPFDYRRDLSKYMNEKIQNYSTVELKYRLLSNYTLLGFNPSKFNISTLITKSENILYTDNVPVVYYDNYGEFISYVKYGWVEGITSAYFRENIAYIVNYLPYIKSYGSTYVTVPVKDFIVVTPRNKEIVIRSMKFIMNKQINIVSENNMLNIINEKLQPITNYEFIAYSPIWRNPENKINTNRIVSTYGLPKYASVTFVVMSNPLYMDITAPDMLYNNINLDKTNYLIRVDMNNEKDKQITIYDTVVMNSYITPYNITLNRPSILTLDPNTDFVKVSSKKFGFQYVDLLQLTFYVINMTDSKTPYIKLKPTNYTTMNKVYIIQTLPHGSPTDIHLKMIYDYSDSDTFTILQINYNVISSSIILEKDIIPYIVPSLKVYYIYNVFHHYYPIPFIYSVIGYNTSSNLFRMYISDKEYIPAYIRVYKVMLNNTFVGKESVNYISVSYNSVTARTYYSVLVPTLYIETTRIYPINIIQSEIPFIALFTNTYYKYDNETYTMYVPYVSIDKNVKAEIVGKVIKITLNKDIYNEQPYIVFNSKKLLKSSEVFGNITIEPDGSILSSVILTMNTSIIQYKVKDTAIMRIYHTYIILPVPMRIEVGSLTTYIMKPNSYVGKLVLYATTINETLNDDYITPSVSSSFDPLTLILLTSVNPSNGIKITKYNEFGVDRIEITTMPISIESNIYGVNEFTYNLLMGRISISYTSTSYQ